MFVRMKGQDLYAGSDPFTMPLRFRASYHKSGQRYLHTPVGRTGTSHEAPPNHLSGSTVLFQTTTRGRARSASPSGDAQTVVYPPTTAATE